MTGVMHDLDELVERSADLLVGAIPAYEAVPRSSLVTLLRRNIAVGLAAYREGRSYSPSDIDTITSTVAQRARQGVPLEVVLRAFSFVEEQVWGWLWQRLHSDDPPLREVMWGLRWRNMEALTWSVSATHREVELEVAREAQEHQALAAQALLSGRLTQADLSQAVLRLGMDAHEEHWVWCLDLVGDREALLRKLVGADPRPPFAVFTTLAGQVAGVSQQRAARAPKGVAGGVAGPVPLAGAAAAYEQAQQAAHAVASFGLDGVSTIEELGLLPAVVSNPGAGEALMRRYLDPVSGAGGVAADLLSTVRVYLEHGGQRDAAARALHLHGNTVSYRINRFVKLTGTDLNDHTALAELWWLFRHLDATGRGASGTTAT